MFQGYGHSGVAIGRFPCAAKVQQTYFAALQHKIFRAYIPMDKPQLMHYANGRKQRLHKPEQFIHRNTAATLLYKLLKRGAFHVFHYDIGCIIRLKKVLGTDYLGLLVHLGHGTGFLKEAGLAFLIPLTHGAGIIGNGQ